MVVIIIDVIIVLIAVSHAAETFCFFCSKSIFFLVEGSVGV